MCNSWLHCHQCESKIVENSLKSHWITVPSWFQSAKFFYHEYGYAWFRSHLLQTLNPLTPNDHYSGRTAPLTSKRCILYIYSTNIDTEYFKRGIYSPFYSLQNAVCLIILTYLVPVLVTFYIQSVLKFKKTIPTPKG